MGHLIIPALWVIWLAGAVGALVALARGPHRTPPLPTRRRDDEQHQETTT